jgi:hypothetical protein
MFETTVLLNYITTLLKYDAAPNSPSKFIRLLIIWPIVLGFIFIICVILGVCFFAFNILIPLFCIYALITYFYGSNWITAISKWVGEQLGSISPYTELGGTDVSGQYIYSCHPHGLLAAAPYIHYGLRQNIATVTTPIIAEFPLVMSHLAPQIGIISSNKTRIKTHLEGGRSLAIILGGAREALATRPHEMRLCADRIGIFKMAVEMKIPIIPVLTYGENEMFTVNYKFGGIIGKFQKWFYKKVHGIWAFPNIREILRWLNGGITLQTFRGAAIEPGDDWEDLRTRYKAALEKLYAETRPADYAAEIEWITNIDIENV